MKDLNVVRLLVKIGTVAVTIVVVSILYWFFGSVLRFEWLALPMAIGFFLAMTGAFD